jgi:hypothetical protein
MVCKTRAEGYQAKHRGLRGCNPALKNITFVPLMIYLMMLCTTDNDKDFWTMHWNNLERNSHFMNSVTFWHLHRVTDGNHEKFSPDGPCPG